MPWLKIFIHYKKFMPMNSITGFSDIKHKVTKGIPIIILDLRERKSFEYASVAEAARFIRIYPKKIRKLINNNELYLNRYKIKVNNYVNIDEIKSHILFIMLCTKCLRFLFRLIKNNLRLIILTFL